MAKKKRHVKMKEVKAKYVEKPPDIDVRRGMFTKLLPDTYMAFRMMLMKRKLSLQEVYEHFAQLCVLGDPKMVKLLDELCVKKRERVYEQMSCTDASSLYDIISQESPLK